MEDERDEMSEDGLGNHDDLRGPVGHRVTPGGGVRKGSSPWRRRRKEEPMGLTLNVHGKVMSHPRGKQGLPTGVRLSSARKGPAQMPTPLLHSVKWDSN